MESTSSLYIYGIHTILEAIQAGKDIERIWVRQQTGDKRHPVAAAADRAGIPTQFVPDEKLDTLAKKQNHQGAVAALAPIEYADLEKELQLLFDTRQSAGVLLLDGITDVRNLGSIARTAECMGISLIILPAHGSARMNGEAIKSSAGALMHLPIARVSHTADALPLLKEFGYTINAITERGKSTIYEADLTGFQVFVMGSEEKGVSGQVMRKADRSIGIPMIGEIASLNVSVATGIVLGEWMRQNSK